MEVIDWFVIQFATQLSQRMTRKQSIENNILVFCLQQEHSNDSMVSCDWVAESGCSGL